MRTFRIAVLSLICFMFMAYQLSVPSFAEEKTAEEYLKENYRLAEKNPQSFVKRPYAGVEFKINSANELVIMDVRKGSPADKAGIKLGDVLMQIDAIKADKKNKVYEYFYSRNPGEDITVLIKRKGKPIKKHITLGLHYEALVGTVLEEMVYKNIPIRLAIIVDDVKSYSHATDPQVKQTIESFVHSLESYFLGSIESFFLKGSIGHANFFLIDRQKTESVINELKFNKSGLVSRESQTELGKILGATHLLFVNIVYFFMQNDFQYTATMKLVEVDSGRILAALTINDTKPYKDVSATSLEQDYKNYLASLSSIADLPQDAMTSYNEALGKMRTDKKTSLDLIERIVIPKYELFTEKLKSIYPSGKDVQKTHYLLMQGSNLRLEAFKLYKTALQNGDKESFRAGDERMKMSNEKLKEYKDSWNKPQAKIEADPNKVAKDVDQLRKDREKSKELEDARKKADDLSGEVERLTKELELSKKDQTKITRYDETEKELSATDFVKKGNILGATKKYEEAIDAFTKAIELNPQDAFAYSQRGFYHNRLGNYNQATKDYNKAIEIDPKNIFAYDCRGFNYFELGRYELAIGDFKECLKLMNISEKDDAYIGLAISYFQLKRIREAKLYYEKAIEIEPLFKESLDAVVKKKGYVYTTKAKRIGKQVLDLLRNE